jgi:HK97 gp10 family phage protein
MYGMTLYGGAELAANLNGLSKAARKRALYPILKDAAEPMRERAAATAHRREPKPDLADNIVANTIQRVGDVDGGKWDKVDDFQAAVATGPAKGFEHGLFLEYGTVHSLAFPFLRPAFDGGVAKALLIIQEGIWALLRKANKKPSDISAGTGTL